MTVPDWAPASADESVVWRGQPRVRVVHWGIVAGAVVAAVVLGVGAFLWRTGATGALLAGAFLAVALLGFAVPAVWAYLWRTHTRYLLTDAALYHRTGTLRITVTELALDRIQNTSYSQGVFGSLFDHGTVTVDTAGSEGPELRFQALDDPDEVHALVATRVGPADGEDPIPGTIAQWRSVLAEVRRLRAVLGPE